MVSRAPIPPERLTVAHFLLEYTERDDGSWELDDGVPVMMSGGTIRHGRVSLNIAAALHSKLRGSGCEPFIFDTLVRTGEHSLRLPDVGIFCDARDIGGDGSARVLQYPSIVFEVLSPSTQRNDRGRKLIEYKQIDTVHTIVFVDAAKRLMDVHLRDGPNAWHSAILPFGTTLTLNSPEVALTSEEIFGVAV